MINLNCLIIDDEPLAHNIIIRYSEDIEYLSIMEQAYGPTEALSIIDTQNFDIIFLDIKMPKMTGLEWLSVANPKSQIIITSAFGEYALESYELNVCDYLLKPFSYSRFLKAAEKAKSQIKLLPNQVSKEKSILLKVDKKYFHINPNDITHLESYGNYVKVHLGETTLLTLRTMASILEQLAHPDFIHVHKSFVVNKQWLHSIEGNMIILKSKTSLPLSRQYKAALMSNLRR